MVKGALRFPSGRTEGIGLGRTGMKWFADGGDGWRTWRGGCEGYGGPKDKLLLYYNTKQPHQGLGGKAPPQTLQNSSTNWLTHTGMTGLGIDFSASSLRSYFESLSTLRGCLRRGAGIDSRLGAIPGDSPGFPHHIPMGEGDSPSRFPWRL